MVDMIVQHDVCRLEFAWHSYALIVLSLGDCAGMVTQQRQLLVSLW